MAGLLISFYAFVLHATVAASRLTVKDPVVDVKTPEEKRTPRRVLALPDLEQSKVAVFNSLTSKSGQRTYDHAISDFVYWYCSAHRASHSIAP